MLASSTHGPDKTDRFDGRVGVVIAIKQGASTTGGPIVVWLNYFGIEFHSEPSSLRTWRKSWLRRLFYV